MRSFLTASVLAGTMVAVFSPLALLGQQGEETNAAAPLEPLSRDTNADLLFVEVLKHDQLRNAALLAYTEPRTYEVTDTQGKVHAEESGQMEYHAPDQKTFVVTSESGSALVRRLALNPLIASEFEAASGKQHRDSSVTPANYNFELLGEQQLGPYHCFVVHAMPKRTDKYLFEGNVWIDARDYAIVRISGHPAKKLSLWIERADFVREYQKVDGFWLPQKDETTVQVRIYGRTLSSTKATLYPER